MSEAITTAKDMYEEVLAFRQKCEEHSSSLPEVVSTTIETLKSLENNLLQGVAFGFKPSQELIENFGRAKLMMEAIDSIYLSD